MILVVERDPQVQALERDFLEQAGYRVELVDNGRAALERARVLRPSILISEILVPDLDGLAVCRAIKAAAETRQVAVLIFSILSAEGCAREAGADAFLRQPLDDARLIGSVELEGSLTRNREVLTHPPASQTGDNTLRLDMELADDARLRTLRVVKARSGAHKGGRRVLRITAEGAKLE